MMNATPTQKLKALGWSYERVERMDEHRRGRMGRNGTRCSGHIVRFVISNENGDTIAQDALLRRAVDKAIRTAQTRRTVSR